MARTAMITRAGQNPENAPAVPARDHDWLPSPREYLFFQAIFSRTDISAAELHELTLRRFPSRRQGPSPNPRERRRFRQRTAQDRQHARAAAAAAHSGGNGNITEDVGSWKEDGAEDLRTATDKAVGDRWNNGRREKKRFRSLRWGECSSVNGAGIVPTAPQQNVSDPSQPRATMQTAPGHAQAAQQPPAAETPNYGVPTMDTPSQPPQSHAGMPPPPIPSRRSGCGAAGSVPHSPPTVQPVPVSSQLAQVLNSLPGTFQAPLAPCANVSALPVQRRRNPAAANGGRAPAAAAVPRRSNTGHSDGNGVARSPAARANAVPIPRAPNGDASQSAHASTSQTQARSSGSYQAYPQYITSNPHGAGRTHPMAPPPVPGSQVHQASRVDSTSPSQSGYQQQARTGYTYRHPSATGHGAQHGSGLGYSQNAAMPQGWPRTCQGHRVGPHLGQLTYCEGVLGSCLVWDAARGTNVRPP